MAKTIAAIRAANLLPVVRWLEANRHSAQRRLDAVDLGYWFNLEPEDPMPLANAITLLRNCAREFGPDFGCQVVGQSSVAELAFVGRIALGARTPFEALQRISAVVKQHCSHETILVDRTDTGARMTQSIQLRLDTESLHAVHVLLCAMIQQLCLFTGLHAPVLARLEMVAHPEIGVNHLRRWFGDVVVAGDKPRIIIDVNAEVADRPFKIIAKDRMPRLMQLNIPSLAEDASLAGSIRPLIGVLLHEGEPSIDRLAASGLMSVRTLQRRLSEEGTNYSAELETVRKTLALKLLGTETAAIGDISERLGYSSPAALSRAVRRLTGAPPSKVRLAPLD
jgi:AraC-like DNA-binding protein